MTRRALVATARSGSGIAEMYSSTVAYLAMRGGLHFGRACETHRSMDWRAEREELASLDGSDGDDRSFQGQVW